MGAVEGHNPWEAAALGSAVLHGPRTANFAADYAALLDARAARLVQTPADLTTALADDTTPGMAARATALIDANMDRLDALCEKLVRLV